MRILISSNAPYAPTGYGTQGKWLASCLTEQGHDVFYMAWYGLTGGSINAAGYTILPNLGHPFGGDAGLYTYRYGIDVLITIQDLWPLPSNFKETLSPKTKWVAWYPVDGEPLTKGIAERLINVDYSLNYSQYGQQIVNESGLQTSYCPLAFEADLFNVGSKSEARDRLGWDASKTYLSMVAMNKGYPCRKGFSEAMQAFKRYNSVYPDSVLYLHTKAQEPRGLDLVGIANSLELPQGSIVFVNQLEYKLGISPQRVADIYRASDALLMPTMGEGFGLPIVEAQACGCPVIAHDCTSVSELLDGGILFEQGQPFWEQQGQWRHLPSVDVLTSAIFDWSQRRDEIAEATIARSSKHMAELYSSEAVAQKYWLPLLAQIEAEQEEIPV